MYFEEVEIMKAKEVTTKTAAVSAKAETKAAEAVKAEQKETEKVEAVKETTESKTEVAATAAEPAKKTTRKTAAKKTETKTTAKKATTAKKTTTKKTAAKAEPEMELFVQYNGNQIDEKSLVEKVMKDCSEQKIKVQDIKLYVKPEENACYYVANGNAAGKVDLY